MNAKKTFKLLGILFSGVGAVIATKKYLRLKKQKVIDADLKKSAEALEQFLDLNDFSEKDFAHIRDSGYTPIYLYDKKNLQAKKGTYPQRIRPA